MLVTVFIIGSKVTGEPLDKVGSLGQAERLVGFEPALFWFWCNTLTATKRSKPVL